jgi:glycyl-tRNA synthetase beta chain
VIVDQTERAKIIETRAGALAHEAGLELIPDAGLVAENAGLTEWPVPLLGRFDPAFLEVPPEVIQLTLRINQKYFVLRDAAGKLANAFICTANIEAKDGGKAIVEGNGKVLAARLSDARFFWEQDKKTPLAVQAQKLERITFHEKLGTVADKVARVAKLAEWLASEGIIPNCDPTLARQAAELCKADLVTEMVGEFPELQGLMGGYYARAEGLPDAVADAIRDHYKPVGQGDDVPTAPVTVAVSLADKLDTLVCFFVAAEKPTGSKDPFALRRAAIAIEYLLLTNQIRASLQRVVARAAEIIAEQSDSRFEIEGEDSKSGVKLDGVPWKTLTFRLADDGGDAKPIEIGGAYYICHWWLRHFARKAASDRLPELLDFFADRLKVQQREAGVRHDLIDAVFALGGEDDLVRLLARVHALQAFIGTDDGVNLLAGYKRAANILKKEQPAGGKAQSEAGEEDPGVALTDPQVADAMRVHESYTPEPAEAALVAALDMAEPRADAAVAAEDFAGAMAALATLRGPIDAFFESVTVNDADPAKRAARLNLLTRIRAAVHKVADFSRIEG